MKTQAFIVTVQHIDGTTESFPALDWEHKLGTNGDTHVWASPIAGGGYKVIENSLIRSYTSKWGTWNDDVSDAALFAETENIPVEYPALYDLKDYLRLKKGSKVIHVVGKERKLVQLGSDLLVYAGSRRYVISDAYTGWLYEVSGGSIPGEVAGASNTIASLLDNLLRAMTSGHYEAREEDLTTVPVAHIGCSYTIASSSMLTRSNGQNIHTGSNKPIYINSAEYVINEDRVTEWVYTVQFFKANSELDEELFTIKELYLLGAKEDN